MVHFSEEEIRNTGVHGIFGGCEGRGRGRQGSQVEMRKPLKQELGRLRGRQRTAERF